jgi:hypothetical protein
MALVKILGAIVSDFARRFQNFLDKIRHHANKIERLAQQGYNTILVDSKDLLESTASSQSSPSIKSMTLTYTSDN